jgi:hypothetical protein
MHTRAELDVKGVTIQGGQGLSQLDKRLLMQRGAVTELVNRLREIRKKFAVMTSVVSKVPSENVVEESDMTVSEMAGKSQQQAEQVKDPLLHSILSGFVKGINGHKTQGISWYAIHTDIDKFTAFNEIDPRDRHVDAPSM